MSLPAYSKSASRKPSLSTTGEHFLIFKCISSLLAFEVLNTSILAIKIIRGWLAFFVHT